MDSTRAVLPSADERARCTVQTRTPHAARTRMARATDSKGSRRMSAARYHRENGWNIHHRYRSSVHRSRTTTTMSITTRTVIDSHREYHRHRSLIIQRISSARHLIKEREWWLYEDDGNAFGKPGVRWHSSFERTLIEPLVSPRPLTKMFSRPC